MKTLIVAVVATLLGACMGADELPDSIDADSKVQNLCNSYAEAWCQEHQTCPTDEVVSDCSTRNHVECLDEPNKPPFSQRCINEFGVNPCGRIPVSCLE